jgi:hypothetical protein
MGLQDYSIFLILSKSGSPTIKFTMEVKVNYTILFSEVFFLKGGS